MRRVKTDTLLTGACVVLAEYTYFWSPGAVLILLVVQINFS
jgi:hypothetical protein